MIPQPKFKIGDRVYNAGTEYTELYDPCPDCVGRKTWRATTPNGESFDVPCPTCSEGWAGSTGIKRRYEHTAAVTLLTIGSVRVDTEEADPVSYMCLETGVGSGTLWRESRLFASAEEAEIAAAQHARECQARMNAEIEKRAAQNRKTSLRKPSSEKRRIAELEKEIAALRQAAA